MCSIDAQKDMAIDIVTSVLNKAQEKLGCRQDLGEIARTRDVLTRDAIFNLSTLKPPLASSSATFIKNAIEFTWKLTDVFKYHLKYLGGSLDETRHCYYFEVIFSQPTAKYPIPQTTCSVFFTVEEKHLEPPHVKAAPMMTFRIEGHYTEHDVRYVYLISDWILAVLMMKRKLYRRIEDIGMF